MEREMKKSEKGEKRLKENTEKKKRLKFGVGGFSEQWKMREEWAR